MSLDVSLMTKMLLQLLRCRSDRRAVDASLFQRLIFAIIIQPSIGHVSDATSNCNSGSALNHQARLAQSVERTALNRVVVGSSPTAGA